MDQMISGGRAPARFASPFITGIKRVLSGIGLFTDTKAYQDEVARYEGEIRRNTGYENEPRRGIEAEEREAATS